MLEKLKAANKIVGIKQLRKALLASHVETVFLADDADPGLTEPLLALCRAQQVRVVSVSTKRELGQACGIEVGAAAAGILKQ